MELLHETKEFKSAVYFSAEQSAVTPPIVEKDYYVTILLKGLSEKLPFIVFKGGTSLSKCHRIIKRFSEDIDITIDSKITQGQMSLVKKAIIETVSELNLSILNLDETGSRRSYNKYL